MTEPLDLDAIRKRTDAATPGPWEADGAGEISQHSSCPEPWEGIVRTSVVCMSFCYGGSSRGVVNDADAEFIAHAREDVPHLVAEVERLRSELSRWKSGEWGGPGE